MNIGKFLTIVVLMALFFSGQYLWVILLATALTIADKNG